MKISYSGEIDHVFEGMVFMIDSMAAALEARGVISREEFYAGVRRGSAKLDEGPRDFVVQWVDAMDESLKSGKAPSWDPTVIEGGKSDEDPENA